MCVRACARICVWCVCVCTRAFVCGVCACVREHSRARACVRECVRAPARIRVCAHAVRAHVTANALQVYPGLSACNSDGCVEFVVF